jgi:hypothetical protein
MERRMKFERDYYPLIENINYEIRGRVIEYTFSRVFGGTDIVTLSSDINFSLYKRTQNMRYKYYDLRDCIQRGDSIYKPAGSDTIFVYKNDGNFYFYLAGQIIK